jgi:UDP-N-acetylmuramate dehydrogenase
MNQLSDYTSLRVGGPAKEIVNASNEAEIIAAVQAADEAGKPVLILGSGTNVLVSDDGFRGVVIHVASSEVHAVALH